MPAPNPPRSNPHSKIRWLLPVLPTSIAFVIAIALTTRLAYAHIFGRFTPFDDEGFFMFALQSAHNGWVLYDELPNIYGPCYYLSRLLWHSIPGISINHEHIRLTTILTWQITAILPAVLTLKLTRSPFLALAVYLQTFFQLTALALEPGHPQELALVLVAATPLAAAYHRPQRRSILLVLGALAAATLLTKINIGLYLGLAILWALAAHLSPSKGAKIATLTFTLIAVLVPFAIMARRLDQNAAAIYAQLVSASAIAAGITLLTQHRDGKLRPREALLLILGGSAAATLILGATLALGSSPEALWDSLILAPTRFAKSLYYPQPLIKSPRAYAIAGLALATTIAFTHNRIPARYRSALYAALKVAFGIVVAINAYNGVYRLFYRAPPLLWILLLPTTTNKAQARPSELGRTVLVAVALLQTLVAFPVPGSQIQWAGFLLIAAGAIALNDGLRSLTAKIPNTISRRIAPFTPAIISLALIALYPLFFLRAPLRSGRFELEITRLFDRYQDAYPLPFPGAQHIRLPHQEYARLAWIAHNLNALDRPFVIFPNNQSFHFFCQRPPSDPRLFFHWNSLSPKRQRALITALENEEKLAIVVDEKLIRLWETQRTNQPIRRWISKETRAIFALEEVSIRVRKQDLKNYTQAQLLTLYLTCYLQGVLSSPLLSLFFSLFFSL